MNAVDENNPLLQIMLFHLEWLKLKNEQEVLDKLDLFKDDKEWIISQCII